MVSPSYFNYLSPFLDECLYPYPPTLNSEFFTDPPAKPITPLRLRALELILTGSIGNTIAVCIFGCLVFELHYTIFSSCGRHISTIFEPFIMFKDLLYIQLLRA